MRQRGAFLVVCLLLGAGCASYTPTAEEIRDVRIELIDIKEVEAHATSLEWELELRVMNPNPFPVTIEYLEVALDIEGSRLGSGSRKGFSVGRYDEVDVTVNFLTSVFALPALVLGSLERPQAPYRLSADVTYKTRSGPVTRHLENAGKFNP